jgi:hypothetical protein
VALKSQCNYLLVVLQNDLLTARLDAQTILLGPILRRVDTNQVCIWIACSKPVTAKAEVFRFSDLHNPENPRAIGSGVAKSIRLGDRLHIALIIARPMQGQQDESSSREFPIGTLLAYDLEITGTNGEAPRKRLADFGLLNGISSISYLQGNSRSLPTFFIKKDNGQESGLHGNDNDNDNDNGDRSSSSLNIIHGSCRKLHGKGEDCLAAADNLISLSFADLSKRPSALFLTGDQIYADDVAGPIARYLTEFSVALLGWEEKIGGTNGKLSDIPYGMRQKLVKENAGFTSGQAENHLLSFGEFAAMYILAWSAENWPEKFPYIRHESDGKQKKYDEQIKHLEDARRDLAAVRRVMANIPTYMIFDDHDVTDDWNITREWYDNVKSSKCGKQVVSNALLAYWAFQGWGNDPSHFSIDFIERIVRYLEKNGNVTASEKASFEDFLWDFHGWVFSAPTKPLAVFIDSRTQRHYDSLQGPPQLIDQNGLHTILKTAQLAGYKRGEPIIIVSAVPLIGFYLFEVLQKAVALATSVYALDLETWYANTKGRTRFLSFLAQEFAPRHCIFMSGDVHFGFTTEAAIAFSHGNLREETILKITQLTSSALKTTSLVKIAFISDILGRIRQMFPFKRIVRTGYALVEDRETWKEQRINWIEVRAIIRTRGSVLSPLIISDNNLGMASIDRDLRVNHRLIVRKGINETKVYEAAARLDKSPLEESLRVRILKSA